MTLFLWRVWISQEVHVCSCFRRDKKDPFQNVVKGLLLSAFGHRRAEIYNVGITGKHLVEYWNIWHLYCFHCHRQALKGAPDKITVITLSLIRLL